MQEAKQLMVNSLVIHPGDKSYCIQGRIQPSPTRGARKTKFQTSCDKISPIDCKTLDPLFNLLFKSGQFHDEMTACGPWGAFPSSPIGFGPGCIEKKGNCSLLLLEATRINCIFSFLMIFKVK